MTQVGAGDRASATRDRRVFRIVLVLLSSLALWGFLQLLFAGADYFLTPYAERPQHPDYSYFRPGGSVGHGLGFLGSAMLLLLLLYSLRKRWRPARNWGAISHWLSGHIFLGIFGPLAIILHSSFKVRGLVSISFWSMVAVALSGVLGRYLYLQIPRNLRGDELGLRSLSELDDELGAKLEGEFGLREETIVGLRSLATGSIRQDAGLASALASSLAGDLTLHFRMSRFRRRHMADVKLPAEQMRQLLKLARRRILLQRRILLLGRLHKIFHLWHVVHKPFAIIMLVIMAVHIAVAMLLGYTWFGGVGI